MSIDEKDLLICKLFSIITEKDSLIEAIQTKIFEPPQFISSLKNEMTNFLAERLQCNMFIKINKIEQRIKDKVFGPNYDKEVWVDSKDFHSYLLGNKYINNIAINMSNELWNCQEDHLKEANALQLKNNNELLTYIHSLTKLIDDSKKRQEDTEKKLYEAKSKLSKDNLIHDNSLYYMKKNKYVLRSKKSSKFSLLENVARKFINSNGNFCNNSPVQRTKIVIQNKILIKNNKESYIQMKKAIPKFNNKAIQSWSVNFSPNQSSSHDEESMKDVNNHTSQNFKFLEPRNKLEVKVRKKSPKESIVTKTNVNLQITENNFANSKKEVLARSGRFFYDSSSDISYSNSSDNLNKTLHDSKGFKKLGRKICKIKEKNNNRMLKKSNFNTQVTKNQKKEIAKGDYTNDSYHSYNFVKLNFY